MESLRIQEIKAEIKSYEAKLKDKSISITEVDQIARRIESMTIELEYELEKYAQDVQNRSSKGVA